MGYGLTVQLVHVTPAWATQAQATMGDKQRRKKHLHLKCIAQDLKNDRFYLNGATIVFDSEGRLIDGQHRLAACVQEKKSFWSLVVRNVDPAAFPAIDIVAKRTGSDTLRSEGHLNSKALAAAVRLMALKEMSLPLDSNTVISPVALKEVEARHPGLQGSILATNRVRLICQTHGTAAFAHYLFRQLDSSLADRFFDKLATGEDLKRGDPVLALRNRFIGQKQNRNEVLFALFKAWNACREKRQMALLRIHDTEKFPEPI